MIDNNKIKIKDVAEIAGVSVGTVDRVMHNRGEVAEETREKVLDAIRKLHYTPNMIARSLALKKKFRFAALLPESLSHNDYWNGPLNGIERAAEELITYKLQIDTYLFSQSDPASFEEKAMEMILTKPDGIIFPPLYEEISYSIVDKCKELDIPVSLIDSNLETSNKVSFIGQSSFLSGYLVGKLMNRLVGWMQGKILIILLGEGRKNSNQVKLRMDGFFEYVRNCACIPPDRLEVVFASDKSIDDLRALINKYLHENEVAGIFVPNSRVYLLCEVADPVLLEKVCVIGYDLLEKNIEFLEQERIDFLIAQNPTKQGYRAVMDLFDHIVLRKEVKKESLIPIDIIMKENYKFYIDTE